MTRKCPLPVLGQMHNMLNNRTRYFRGSQEGPSKCRGNPCHIFPSICSDSGGFVLMEASKMCLTLCKRTSSARPPWSLSWRRFFVLQISNYLINLSANNATLDFNLSAVMHKLPFLQTLQHLIESTLLCTKVGLIERTLLGPILHYCRKVLCK